MIITHVTSVFGLQRVHFCKFKVLWDIVLAVFSNSGRVRNLLVMVFRLNKSLKYHELIPTPDCSGPAPPFVAVNSVYCTARVSSTMPEKTPFHCPKFSCRKNFTSDSGRLNNIKLDNPEQLQVARQKKMTVCSVLRRIVHAQCRGFNANNGAADHLHMFP